MNRPMTQMFYKTIYGTDVEDDQPIEMFLSKNMKLIIEKLQLHNSSLLFDNIQTPREGCIHCGHEREPSVPVKDIEQLRVWRILDVISDKKIDIIPTDIGYKYINSGLPEEKLWAILPVSINNVPMDRVEKTVAIGVLKRIGAINIENGVIKKANLMAYNDYMDNVLLDLRANKYNSMLIDRGILKQIETNRRYVSLTPIGKKLMGNAL